MVSFTMTAASVRKFGQAALAKTAWNLRLVLAATPRTIQVSSGPPGIGEKAAEAAQTGANEAMQAGQTIKNKALSAAEDMTQNTRDMATSASEAAQSTSETARETMPGAMETAEETKEFVKENAESVIRSMNSKNLN